MSRSSRKLHGWDKEVKEAKSPSWWADLGHVVTSSQSTYPIERCLHRRNLQLQTAPIIWTDRQTCNRGWQMAKNIFLPSKQGEVGAPAPGRGGLFNLPSPLCRPQIVSSSNSCSRGGRSSTETYSCPSTNTTPPRWGSSPMGPTLSPAPPASVQTVWTIF